MRSSLLLAAALAATLVTLWPGGAAHAQTPAPLPAPGAVADDVSAYAIIIGSNPGGPGQDELRFAEDDARRVADVLRELGGYRSGDIELVLRPDPATVNAAIDRIAQRAAADRAAGRQSQVFFYYSGHARATALNLGAAELPLAGLRERLLSLPATLTVVVLDACQSGAFSRVKGAAPAADFSFNSRARLDARGVAVMASSSASELSQESDLLRSSYFTHHLLVGLRGAGDANRDGRVSLDEAYRYAYHQTLLATAATAVGRQHVSLEVDLKGQGEVPLTYPERASAGLSLPAALEGEILVERLPAQAVIAEIHKSRGKPVRLALAPGQYRVMVREDDAMVRCPVVIVDGGTAEMPTRGCDRVPLVDAAAKHGRYAGPLLQYELAVGFSTEPEDQYIDTLRDFGYQGSTDALRLTATGLYRVHPYVTVGGELGASSTDGYERSTDAAPLRYDWQTGSVTAIARAEARSETFRLVPFVQAGAGLSVARTTFTDDQDLATRDTFLGWHLAAAAGLSWVPYHKLGFVLRFNWSYAPVIDNLVGDTHDAGGLGLTLGFHYEH